jgi:N-acetylglutamate synthase-like GNAT family acetyltransferase
MTTFRRAIKSDAKQISDLIHLVGINPSGLEWSRFFVAINSTGEVIGCGQVKPHGREIRELASIAVHPNHRGEGLARKVIEKLLEENPGPLYLMCMSHNGGLYEKFGFRIPADEQLPPYFRRIKKLFNLARLFRKTGEELLVMKLE